MAHLWISVYLCWFCANPVSRGSEIRWQSRRAKRKLKTTEQFGRDTVRETGLHFVWNSPSGSLDYIGTEFLSVSLRIIFQDLSVRWKHPVRLSKILLKREERDTLWTITFFQSNICELILILRTFSELTLYVSSNNIITRYGFTAKQRFILR